MAREGTGRFPPAVWAWKKGQLGAQLGAQLVLARKLSCTRCVAKKRNVQTRQGSAAATSEGGWAGPALRSMDEGGGRAQGCIYDTGKTLCGSCAGAHQARALCSR